jgi:hypothetical protein
MARLLSFAPPVPTEAGTLAPALGLVWAAALAGAMLAAAGRRLSAALGSVVVLVAALLLVGRTAPAPGWVAPVVGLGAAVLALSDSPSGRWPAGAATARKRRVATSLLGGGLAAVLALVAGLAAAQVIGDRHRADPAAKYQPPQARPQPVDPLTRLAGWAQDAPQPLAEVRFGTATGPATPTAWRWAVLDQFDGARWTSSQQFRPSGGQLRTTGTLGTAPVTAVQAALTVDPVLSPWLPSPGELRAVKGLPIAVDSAHDAIVQAGGPSGPASYELAAEAGSLDPLSAAGRAAIARLSAGPAPGGAGALAAPGLPERLHEIALGFAPGQGGTDGQRALALQTLLRHGQFQPDAPSGYLYARLTQFFDDTRTPVYLRGTSEQFATSFAVLARAAGLPSRVVVGFTLPADPGAKVSVSTRQVRAWPEVWFSGSGWVRFDPTPSDRSSDTSKAPPKLKQLVPQTAQRPQPVQVTPPKPARKPPAAKASGAGRLPVVAIAATVVVAVLLLLAVAALLVAALRLRQRARRRRGSDAERVLGAWQDLADALVLAGAARPADPDHSAGTLAARARERISGARGAGTIGGTRSTGGTDGSGPALAELARLANASAFGGPDAVSAADAERARAIGDEAVAGLRRASGRRRRLTWWLDPGPLRRR